MIVTISAVEPFGDYGVGVHHDKSFVVHFSAQGAMEAVREHVSGPDDRLRVRGESANPVFVETVNTLLGTSHRPWAKMPDGFFSVEDLR